MKPRAWIALAFSLAVQGALAAPAAEVVSLEGKGEFREAQQSTWRPAVKKQPLFPTNFVRTLDMSRMAILFADRTQMLLSPNSTLQVLESGPGVKTDVNFNGGRSWGTSKAPPQGMTVRTPSATAAIRGTEWEIVVDEEGRATLSVLAGEVEFFNDQGTVLVAANEQARAERGKAPVKLQLRVSRERVQWVSSATVDSDRYREPQLEDITRLVREQRLAEAYALARSRTTTGGPGAYLLLADFEVYRGDLAAAGRILDEGRARDPKDPRFDVALARIALFSDRPADALALAQAAVAKDKDWVDGWIALGDIERHEGRAREAAEAYSQASRARPTDARPWYGLGVIESERENVGRARHLLREALRLDPQEADAWAELATVEAFAANLPAARENIGKALAINPDNYVALTGLGVIELRSGNTEAAIDALSRALLLEPRYARAHVYLAAALYQLERVSVALEELARAADLDPRDPLPHILASIIHLDRIDPGPATDSARDALARLPFLKSLNPIANNLRGVGNVGYPLSFMGLESWARSAAQESYLPFWAASHLFLADRYPGEFNRRSELMQGFITDPLVFGASNRYQSLFLTPGNHATVSLRANTSDDVRVYEPAITVNGYRAGDIPFAYFAEAGDATVEPRALPFDARMRTATVALGAKPSHELGLFVYATHLSADVDIGTQGVTGQFNRIDGKGTRVDAGARYAPDARSSLWIKVGAGDEDTTSKTTSSIVLSNVSLVREVRYAPQRRTEDGGVRYTRNVRDDLEVTLGAEAARLRNPIFLQQDAAFHSPSQAAGQERLDENDRDKYQAAYGVGRATFGALRIEAGAVWRDYRKDRDFTVSRDAAPGADVSLSETHHRSGVDPMLGATLRLSPTALVRGACRRWLRPIALDTMMPVAIGGVPLDDQLVLPGGELEQCRLQAEWTFANRTFIAAYAERIETANLISFLDGVLNTRGDVTNLERLRNRVFIPPTKPDVLEETPVYAGGVIQRGNLALEHRVTPGLGARLHYTYTDSENTLFTGMQVPYLPRHQVNLALAWSPGWRSQVVAQATYRSRRFTDETNTVALAPGWDASLDLFVESPDKRWSVALQAANLFKKDTPDVFGIVLSYRF